MHLVPGLISVYSVPRIGQLKTNFFPHQTVTSITNFLDLESPSGV